MQAAQAYRWMGRRSCIRFNCCTQLWPSSHMLFPNIDMTASPGHAVTRPCRHPVMLSPKHAVPVSAPAGWWWPDIRVEPVMRWQGLAAAWAGPAGAWGVSEVIWVPSLQSLGACGGG